VGLATARVQDCVGGRSAKPHVTKRREIGGSRSFRRRVRCRDEAPLQHQPADRPAAHRSLPRLSCRSILRAIHFGVSIKTRDTDHEIVFATNYSDRLRRVTQEWRLNKLPFWPRIGASSPIWNDCRRANPSSEYLKFRSSHRNFFGLILVLTIYMRRFLWHLGACRSHTWRFHHVSIR
jgi:hypothetical protein